MTITTNSNKLIDLRPELEKEWMHDKNDRPFKEMTKGSHYKAWWKCKENNCKYEWDAVVSKRYNGRGCPACAGSVVTDLNRFTIKRPEAAKEWNYDKNGDLKPENFSLGANKKVWWKCSDKECEYEWESVISDKSRGKGCPACTGNVVTDRNRLTTKNPELIKEWNYKKNGELKPEDFSYGATRKVWWECVGEKCKYEWKTTILTRSSGSGCPACAGNVVTDRNRLTIIKPEIAKEWNYEKNGELRPENFSFGSGKKVWWKCADEECEYEWETTITARSKGSGCPECAGQVPNQKNCLKTIKPLISKQWHPMKNGNLTPDRITAHSRQEVWWLCNVCSYEWEKSPFSRKSLSLGCPECNKSFQSSFPEQAIFYYFKKVFVECENKYKHKKLKNGLEIDVFLPSLNVAIEYDGKTFHEKESNTERDRRKMKLLKENDIITIKVREKGLLSNDRNVDKTIIHEYPSLDHLTKCIKEVFLFLKEQKDLSKKELGKIEKLEKEIDVEKDQVKILGQYLKKIQKNSLKNEFPDVASEWNSKQNGLLKPENVMPYSSKKVWWKCKKDPKHEWDAVISSRTRQQQGCPFCSGRRATLETCFATVQKELLKEWHPKKNIVSPYNIKPRYSKKVWWQCQHDKKHEWEATPDKRYVGKGKCPHCPRKKKVQV